MRPLVQFEGRLVEDSSVRFFGDGSRASVSFTVAVNHSKRVGGEWKALPALFLSSVFFVSSVKCDVFVDALKKGVFVQVRGFLEDDSYMNSDGVRFKGFKVVVDSVGVVPQVPASSSGVSAVGDSEEIPPF